jgi:hypothetical protein
LELTDKQKAISHNNINQQQISSYEAQLDKIKGSVKEKEDTIGKLSEMT